MVGILAFGSLRDDPGYEIDAKIVERRPVTTPFPVEFALDAVAVEEKRLHLFLLILVVRK